MIGKKIRGFHHFRRMMEDLQESEVIFYSQAHRNLNCGYAYNTKNGVIITTNAGKHRIELLKEFLVEEKTLYKHITENTKDYFSFLFISNPYDYAAFATNLVILPKSFNDDYNKMIQSNRKLFGQIFGRYCSEADASPKFLYHLFEEKANIIAWALTALFKRSLPLSFFEHIALWNNKYGQLSKNLKRGTMTAYNNMEDIVMLDDECFQLKRDKRINDVFNLFNTSQKKLLKAKQLTDREKEAISKFDVLSSTKKQNFIRKMSTIENAEDILSKMEVLCNVHFKWDKESLMNYISNSENIKCEIIQDENNIVLVKVNTYDTIKYLAKSTNWCISKNKSYWNNYVESNGKSQQYVLFNFNLQEDDEYSIVGFTTNENGTITNAHSFTNKDIKGGEVQYPHLKCFKQNLVSISDILRMWNIKFSNTKAIVNSFYDWNKESVLKALGRFADETDLEGIVYLNKENKLVVSLKGEYAKALISPYYDNIYDVIDVPSNPRYIVFFDFDLPQTDPNHITFAIINTNLSHNEEYVLIVFNVECKSISRSIDAKLEEYDLPYDIIKRPNDLKTRIINAFNNFNLPMVKSLSDENPQAKKILKEYLSENGYQLYEILSQSLMRIHTLDYLRLVLKEGIQVEDIIGSDQYADLMTSLFHYFSADRRRFHIPTEIELADIQNGIFTSHYVETNAYYYAFLEMLHNIKRDETFSLLFHRINGIGQYKDSVSTFLVNVFSKAKLENINVKFMLNTFRVIAKFHLEKTIENALKDEKSKSVFKEQYNKCFGEGKKKSESTSLSYDFLINGIRNIDEVVAHGIEVGRV